MLTILTAFRVSVIQKSKLKGITWHNLQDWRQALVLCSIMGLDNVLSSPHRRPQTAFSSPTFKKFVQNDISCSALVQRHRFLLTTLVLLAVLCTVYLYFAVTLGSDVSCSGLLGSERELCLLKHEKGAGKLRHFWLLLLHWIVFALTQNCGLFEIVW